MSTVYFADDLTGANDAGVQLLKARAGCGSLIYNKDFKKNYREMQPLTENIIIDLETRLLDSKSAYNKTFDFLKAFKRDKKHFFKKIDSTLRGNVKSELEACRNALHLREPIPVVAAFPEAGRITLHGIHFVGQKLLQKTEYASDILNPVNTSYVADILGKSTVLIDIKTVRTGPSEIIKSLALAGKKGSMYAVIDCVSQNDLRTIGHALKGCRLVCGAAGLLREMGQASRSKKLCNDVGTYGKKIILLIGTMKQASFDQLHFAEKRVGLKIFKLSYKELISGHGDLSKRSKEFDSDILAICLDRSPGSSEGINKLVKQRGLKKASELLTNRLGAIASGIIERNNIKKMIVTGGATALSLCNALHISKLILLKNIYTGTALTYDPDSDFLLVTKPGGFGKKDTMLDMINELRKY